MKATQKDFASIAPRAARTASVFFFCGPDEAGASDAAVRILSLLDDPGECIELPGSDLRRDPVRLGDEARSNSLFGGSRHIRVRAQGDEAHDAVENLVASDIPFCPVIIVATNATDKSRTAKLLAPRDNALVAMFWPPDLRSVAGAVRQMADAAGLRLSGSMAEQMARAANLDTRVARSEVEKLALYLDASPQAPRTVAAEAIDAIAVRNDDDSLLPMVNAVLGGEVARLPAELRRLREQGINPVSLLLALERRAAQLAQIASRGSPGMRVAEIIAAERAAHRINFREERDLVPQLERWRGARLARLVDRLVALHRRLLGNSQQAELFLAQELAEIARVASR